MLDNFGMGEFLMLALFALLFFGPERLPQIGARVGRWLGQLTQASKVFMTQWTEEAAAIQDAVREVQGIRDEIRAAQAEISGSLDIARQDIEQTIGEARSTVREAAVTPQGILQAGAAKSAAPDAAAPDTSAPPRLATPEEAETATRLTSSTPSGNENEALSKTQDVLDDLLAKRGLSPETTDASSDDGAEPAEKSDAAQDDEYERNLQAIQEIMERDAQRAEEKAKQAELKAEQTTAPPSPEPDKKADQEEAKSEEPEEPQETAFDKTQRILDGLLGKASEPEPKSSIDLAASAQEESELPEAVAAAEAAPDEASGAIAKPVSAAEAARPAVRPDEVQRVTDLQQGISYNEFTQLSIQVSQLRRELKTLQKEIQALRGQASGSDASSGPGAAPDNDSNAVPMEEAA